VLANILTDPESAEDLEAAYPEVYGRNVWPSQPDECPGLEEAFMEVGKGTHGVGKLLAQSIDKYLVWKTRGNAPEKRHEAEKIDGLLQSEIQFHGKASFFFSDPDFALCCQGSLFGDRPRSGRERETFEWKVDFGLMSVLVPPIYLKNASPSPQELPEPTQTGLFVRNNLGETIKCVIPKDCLAVKVGECLQYFSAGYLRTTPYCLRPYQTDDTTTSQFITYIDLHPQECFIAPPYTQSYSQMLSIPQLPDQMPTLESRLFGTTTYKQFQKRSFKLYRMWYLQKQHKKQQLAQKRHADKQQAERRRR
jgi:hypothetical protein